MSNCKLPATFQSNKLIKIISEKGFRLEGSTGSHSNYCKEGHPNVVTIKVNSEIPRGTLINILKQAGISRDEFCDLITKKKKRKIKKRKK